MDKGKTPIEKRSFINNVGLFLSAREKMLNHFKNKIFPIKNLDKIPTPKSTLVPTVFHAPAPTRKPRPDRLIQQYLIHLNQHLNQHLVR